MIALLFLLTNPVQADIGSRLKNQVRKPALQSTQQQNKLIEEIGYGGYLENGDLPEIKERGQIRVIITDDFDRHLPRTHDAVLRQLETVEAFAERQNLKIFWVRVQRYDQIIPYLLAGKGDLAIASLTITEDRERKGVTFTQTVTHVREQLIGRQDDSPKDCQDLKDREVFVRRSSSYWRTLSDHIDKGFKRRVVDESESTVKILSQVAEGRYDLTVADSDIVDSVLDYQPELKIICSLSKDRSVAWGVRKTSEKLLQELNDFLRLSAGSFDLQERYLADLAEIKKRGVLRLLTSNNAASYFVWRGRLMGFDYELVRLFARTIGVRVEVIVPPKAEDLMSWLAEGRGDIAVSSLTLTDSRLRHPAIKWSSPYLVTSERIVQPKSENLMAALTDLDGETICARPSSSYWHTIRELQKVGRQVKLRSVPEEWGTATVIEKVETGECPMTLADEHIIDLESHHWDRVAATLTVKSTVEQGWAVAARNTNLLASINRFISRHYRGLHYNVLYSKYFRNHVNRKNFSADRLSRSGKLSPYDNIVKQVAEKIGFDWRLITAQMFQESQFDPGAESFAGALGLLQVLPATGREMGFRNLAHPVSGITAGVRYLAWLWDKFDDIGADERIWFALASYNAGYGHVWDAQAIARQKGWDAKKWFGHTEEAMLLLARRSYARRARYGYCRGSEPVQYVRNIRSYYLTYLDITENRP